MELVVLSQNNCSKCDELKVFLDNEGIEYKTINLSDEPDYKDHYGVMSTPVTILEEDGEEVTRVHGVKKDEILDLADEI